MSLLHSDARPDHTIVIHDVRIIQTPFWLLTMLLFHKHDSQVPSSFAFLLEPWIACLLLESGLLHHDANQGQAPSLAPPLLDVSLTRLYRSRPSWPLSMQCISHYGYEVGPNWDVATTSTFSHSIVHAFSLSRPTNSILVVAAVGFNNRPAKAING